MANYNNYQRAPFWDFIRSFEQSGAGVDHPAGEDHPFWGAGPAGPHHPPPPPPPAGPHHPPPPPPPGSFPFGGPGPHGFWGRGGFGGPGPRGGRRGRHGGRHGRRGERSGDEDEREERSRSRTASPSGEHAEGEEAHQSGNEERRERGPRSCGRHGRRGGSQGHAHGHGGRGGPWDMGGRGGFGGFGPRDHHDHHHGGPGHHGRRCPPPPFGMGGPGGFDLSGLFESLNSHPVAQQPWAQVLRQYAQQYGFTPAGEQTTNNATRDTLVAEDTENSFIPPIDVFSTETAYILHVALPGAKKEDVGVNWDSDKGSLNIAGVVYRQGDEEFLKQLSQSERKVGVFDRSVKLPPGNEDKEEVDGDNIAAKLEDGVLVVTVPKVEREWTEVKRVDIE